MDQYAVVKFPTENLIGIISTKWILSDGKECLYPASKKDLFNMGVILKKNSEALPGWDKHPIIILGRFASYAAAKAAELKAEDTSNLSEEEESEIRGRKRRPTTRYWSDESSRSPSPLPKRRPQHPPPPIVSPQQPFPPESFSEPLTLHTPTYSPLSHQHKSLKTPPLKKNLPIFPPLQSPHPPQSPTNHQSPCGSATIAAPSSSAELSQVLDKLNHLIQISNGMNERMEEMAEEIRQLRGQQTEGQQTEGSCVDLFKHLPIKDMEGFEYIEKKLSENEQFKKSFVKSMSVLGGRDAHRLTINILKTLMNDNVGELFSLTGKKFGNFPAKRKFEATEICSSIFDAVRRRHKDIANDIIKNTIKIWLQQATPRILKREKRLGGNGNLEGTDDV